MKKFSLLKESVEEKSKDTLKNEIYSIIDETLSVKFSKEELATEDVDINGKEEMIDKIKELIIKERKNERLLTLEHVKLNTFRNFDMNWLNEQIQNLSIEDEKVEDETYKDN
jgi:hypothetical protein